MKPASQRAGITQAQRKMLFAARKKLGMDDATWRDLLERIACVRSSTGLDQVGFDLVIRELERLGFRNTSRGKPFGERPGFATPPQVALIKRLWGEYVDQAGSEKGLSTWLRRTYQIDHLRFLGFDEARGAIEGLKVMVERRRRALAKTPPAA